MVRAIKTRTRKLMRKLIVRVFLKKFALRKLFELVCAVAQTNSKSSRCAQTFRMLIRIIMEIIEYIILRVFV